MVGMSERKNRTLGQRHPRHPAEVTSDRLGDHYGRWHGRLTPAEREAITKVRDILERIAEEDGADR